MAAVAVETKKPARTLGDFQTKRSKAMPKNTLFGSVLEKRDEEELKKIGEMDLEAFEVASKPRLRVRDPPPALNYKIPETNNIQQAQRELEQRLKRMKDAEQRLAMLETHARYYPQDITNDKRSPKSGERINARPHQWISERDLRHTSEMNLFGVNCNTKSFNRDKYEKLPPVHKYALIGDVLRPGMDFTERKPSIGQVEEPDVDADMYNSHYTKVYGRRKNCAAKTKNTKFAVDLPKNIQHQFGTKVCEALLSDDETVKMAMKEQERVRACMMKYNEAQPPLKEVKPSGNPSYVELSNVIRHNVVPGYTFGNQRSLMKSAYTKDVHERHEPDPDEFRYRRDELSTWAEHNILRDRMKKRFDLYLDSKPQLEKNWDTTARRPPPPPPEKPKPPKEKPKKTPKGGKTEGDIKFDDVVFVTPPVTPPAKPPSPIKAEPYVRDDAFWDFYGKKV